MTDLKIFELKKEKGFEYWPTENLSFKPLLREKHLSISLDEMKSEAETPYHYHDRPNNGKETLIIFQGKIKLKTENVEKVFDVDQEGPVLLVIDSNEYKQIKNVGDKDAKILAMFTPPFDLKEVEHIEKERKELIKPGEG